MTTTSQPHHFDLDYIEVYVSDLEFSLSTWCDQYGFERVAVGGSLEEGCRSVVVRRGEMSLVLTEAVSLDHPAATYIKAHGDGVVDIAMRTNDVQATYDAVVTGGGTGLVEPWRPDSGDVSAVARVAGFGDVVHTLVQRGQGTAGIPVGYTPVEHGPVAESSYEVLTADHFAVIVPVDRLDPTIDMYCRAFGFDEIFAERIVIGKQVMNSKVVQSISGTVTLTIISPDLEATQTGQIDDFINNHGGAGVQHIALSVDDVLRATSELSDQGVEFLTTPGAYYDHLSERISEPKHATHRLRELNILVDEDHGGQMFQIFTRTIHPRRTLFFEIIERRGARTFGSANIKALYEAVEVERVASP